MPLPSQSARPQSRNTYMFRRRRSRRRVLTVMLLALFGLTIGVWAWTRSDSPQRTSAESLVAADDSVSEFGEPSPARDRAEETPRVTMGRPVPLQNQPDAPPRALARPNTEPARPATPPAEPAPEREQPPSTQPQAEPPSPARTTLSPSAPREAAEPSSPARQRALDRMKVGMDLLAANKPVEARRALTQALLSPGIDGRTARSIRETLIELNDRLVFGREIVHGDPYVFGYTIRPGDTLAKIASQQNTNIDWRFIQRINGIQRPEQIRAGQKIKLVQGPFHAVVVKEDFRLDVFLGEGSDRVYVRSFAVGLGEHDSTPVGRFRVRENSKLINPAWTNPRTGEHFTANDPENPIGDRWIGLEGVTEAIRDLSGYGIHGTIEPDSIGQQQSMGCIRLGSDDVELLYEMLVERESTVEIVNRH